MSCLFRSLAHFVPEDNEYIIRQKICNYMILNRPIAFANAEQYVQWESDQELSQYVSKMRQIYIWGSATEIQAFCELYNFIVNVHNLRDKGDTIVFASTRKNHGSVKHAHISWSGNHYEPIPK